MKWGNFYLLGVKANFEILKTHLALQCSFEFISVYCRDAVGPSPHPPLGLRRHRDGDQHGPQQSGRHLQGRRREGQDQVGFPPKQPVGARQFPREV